MSAPSLSVEQINKAYGANRVLRNVSLQVAPGEIAALLGENGAGKSTLLKILSGVVSRDSGIIQVKGTPATFNSPREAQLSGITYIPQELTFVPKASVAENVCMGMWPGRRGLTSPTATNREARRLAALYGFDIPFDKPMDQISRAEQQLVEILKALMRDARVILLDEPTAALPDAEVNRLFGLIHSLATDGVSFLYVSHRLDEVYAECDSVHILRNGEMVRSGPIGDLKPTEAVEAMLGRPLGQVVFERPKRRDREVALELRGWSRKGAPSLTDVSLCVGVGEVVAIYGLRGSGAEYVAETLGGLHDDVDGATEVGGRRAKRLRSPRQAQREGIAYLPGDRKANGLVPSLSVRHQMTLLSLGRVSRFGFIRGRTERELVAEHARRVQLRSRGLTQTQRELSGGNQQKVMLASRLMAEPKVLVLEEPTRGVDVGARLEIHALMREMAGNGSSMLVVSSDIEEVTTVPHRVLVMRDGEIVASFDSPTTQDQSEILRIAGGVK